jgi:putative ABC transport system permease protein
MQTILQDARYAVRTLLKNPGFAAVAIITLALGIGANTAIFSLVNAAMIRPLPYPNASRLMTVFHAYTKYNMSRVTVYPNAYAYYRDHVTSFEQIAAYSGYKAPQNLTGGGDPERVQTIKATWNFFPTLGTRPLLGRVFNATEDTPGAARVAVLSYGLWNTRFASDPGILNREITLDGANYTVIGVMPKGFEYPEKAQLWVPMAFTAQELADGPEYLECIAILRLGATRQQAQAEMAKVTREILARDNDLKNPAGWSAETLPMQAATVSDMRTALWVLLAAVGCVLLIACANVANLLLARATARQKEIAIRAALGASRWRMVRQLLTEGVLLGIVGGALGLLFCYFGLDLLLKTVPTKIPSYIRVEIDPTVLAFTFALGILTGLIFSAVPALQLTRSDVNDVLKEGGRGSGAAGHHFMRGAIVAAQLAVAMILLVSAGLLIKSFVRLQHSDLGFNPQGVLTFRTELPREKYEEPAQQVAFFDQLLERERVLPGVVSAALTSTTPLTRNMSSTFTIEGKTFDVAPHVHVAMIGPQYFSTMQIPVQTGRDFTAADREDGLPVALIDTNTARAYFRGEDPIGKKLMFTFEGTREKRIWRTIVGVVGSVKHTNPLETETKGQIFLPFAQSPNPGMIVALRTTGDPSSLANPARAAVLSVDPLQPVQEIQSMEDVLDDFIAQPRFNMVLLGTFAALALVLSVIGVYGVMAYSVTQRTHEFGIRMALGASGAHVLRSVLTQALRIACVGLVAGVLGAFIATRALASMLFGVKATDPSTFAAIALLLIVIAALASYLPARRATKVDPMVALRYE